MNKELFEKIEKIITINCDITDYYEDEDGDETDEPCRYALGEVSLEDSVIKICDVIEQAKKDTAREILQNLFDKIPYYDGEINEPILPEIVRALIKQEAVKHGVELKDGEE